MEKEQAISLSFSIVLLFLGLLLAWVLLKYYSTILLVKRNLLFHLNALLVICFNICIISQCGSVSLRLSVGPLPSPVALGFHLLFYFSIFLCLGTVMAITLTRLFLVFQPVRFCNLNHESVFRKIFALLFLEALIPPTVDLIYTHETSTIFQDFLSDHNSFQWNLNINLLVETLCFIVLVCLLILLARVAISSHASVANANNDMVSPILAYHESSFIIILG